MSIPPARAFVTRVREASRGSLEQINPDRCAGLLQIKDCVVASQLAREPAKLLFICTHNPRRSHMGQLWAQVAQHILGYRGF